MAASVVVFAGPTIAAGKARGLLDACYLPPASQGAIVRCVLERRPAAILLIDAVFQGEPTVRHKEILWALSRGVAVYGAASMGALRAAELHQFGMVGVGLIYRWYRRYALAPDDAVAVLHGPPELGSLPLTLALVDLRLSLRDAERAGMLNRALRLRLERTAIDANFRDRVLERIAEAALAGASAAEKAELERAVGLLPSLLRAQKRRDAEAALSRVARDLNSPAWRPPEIKKPFVMTTAFLQDLRDDGISLD